MKRILEHCACYDVCVYNEGTQLEHLARDWHSGDEERAYRAAQAAFKNCHVSDIVFAFDFICDEILDKYKDSPDTAAALAFIAGMSAGKHLERARTRSAYWRGFDKACDTVRALQARALDHVMERVKAATLCDDMNIML